MRSGLVRSKVPRTSTSFVEIMPDKVILEHKKSYLVSFENFHLFSILSKNWPYSPGKTKLSTVKLSNSI